MALPNKTKIPVGTVLAGKYRITRELGRGGMASVYEAENVDIGKRVAIKVLAQELTASAIVVERFLREARAAAAIRSPYICDVYDSGKLDDGRPFLVLELLEGESLYERMTKVRWFDAETTVSIMLQVCRGLTKAHAAQIVHRDLKPENIFLTKDEEGKLLAKILDFGLAKFYAPIGGDAKQARLTREGAVFGTPAYMSPEQVRGQGAVDHRADLWALGCIVYECLTGRTVWSTDQGVAMTFAQIANAPLPRPQQYRPDLPASFTEWFDRALHRDIDKRYQTAKEFAETLAVVFKQRSPSFSALHALPALMDAPPPTVSSPNPFLDATPVPENASSPVFGALTSSSGSLAAATADQATAAPEGAPPAPASGRGSKLGFVASPKPEAASPDPPPAHKGLGPIGIAALGVGALAIAGATAYVAWTQLGSGAKTTAAPTASAPASAAPAASESASASASAPLPRDAPASIAGAPPWIPIVRSAQETLAKGDVKGAMKLLKDAFDKGGHGVPRTMLDHLAVAAAAGDKAPCKVTGLARPRTYDLAAGAPKPGHAGRPSIGFGPRGAVVVWTDPHEGAEHAWAAALDDAMRAVAAPVDVTPEGASVYRPELVRAGEKLLLSYGDARGAEAGIHVRLLDGDGRIAGPSVAVSPVKGGPSTHAVAAGPDGSFYVAWSDDTSSDSEDLFLRHLNGNLEPGGAPARATDLVPAGPGKPRARLPAMAIAGGALLLAYRLERDPLRVIEHLRVPLGEAGKGLEPAKKGAPRADRTIGEVALVNSDKSKADTPELACGGGGCFLVWHGEAGGGASAAYVEPAKAKPLWWRKFSKAGARPSVAVAPSGQAQLVWYEAGKVVTAPVDRNGVGTPTRIARVSGDQPPASIVPGKAPGEWYVAWLDYETGHLEPYAARFVCK